MQSLRIAVAAAMGIFLLLAQTEALRPGAKRVPANGFSQQQQLAMAASRQPTASAPGYRGADSDARSTPGPTDPNGPSR